MTTATALLNRALLDMAVAGNRVRCADPNDHTLWTSEHQQERDIAATWCVGCDVLQFCGDAAEEREEKWGVYAGIDRSIRVGSYTPRTQ